MRLFRALRRRLNRSLDDRLKKANMDKNYNELLKSRIREKREEQSPIELSRKESEKESFELRKTRMSALAQHLNSVRGTIEQGNLIKLDITQGKNGLTHVRITTFTGTDNDIEDWFTIDISYYMKGDLPLVYDRDHYSVHIIDPAIPVDEYMSKEGLGPEDFHHFEDFDSVIDFVIERCSTYIAKHLKQGE